jgi:hypothetical protein
MWIVLGLRGWVWMEWLSSGGLSLALSEAGVLMG